MAKSLGFIAKIWQQFFDQQKASNGLANNFALPFEANFLLSVIVAKGCR